jgi:sugar phosphate permease
MGSTTSTTPRSDATRREGVYRWQVVAMLWLVCFFNYADRQAIYAVFPLLEEEFGFDKFQLGLLTAAFLQ